MFRIEVKGFSERAYPRHLVLKADGIGALKIINMSEIKEGKYDFAIWADDWAVTNTLHTVQDEKIGEHRIEVVMSNEEHPIRMKTNFPVSETNAGIVMQLPEWAVANIIITLLTTLELNELFERKIK
jgi:hypothetical protein